MYIVMYCSYVYIDDTKLKLHLVTEERDRLKKEKEEQFQVMKEKIKSLEKAYQVILEVNGIIYVSFSKLFNHV